MRSFPHYETVVYYSFGLAEREMKRNLIVKKMKKEISMYLFRKIFTTVFLYEIMPIIQGPTFLQRS